MKWEYKIIFANIEHLGEILDNHGANGWEAWSITSVSSTCDRVIFKRRRWGHQP